MITIGRRQFLHNAGRLMLLPVFQGLWNGSAAAAVKSPAWVHMYFPMGCFTGDWKLNPAGILPAHLQSFAPIQKQMLWFNDVNNPVPGDGGHEQAGGGSLTGASNKNNGTYDKSYNTSADQILANHYKSSYAGGAMALSRAGFQQASDCCRAFESGLNYISWLEPGKNAPTLSDPSIAMKQFFSSGTTVDNVAATLADGKSSLDFFTAQVSAAKAKIGKDDAQRLDQYTQAMRDYEQKTSLSLTSQAQCKLDPSIVNSNDFLIHQNAMLDLIALSLQCNVTPAITFMMDFEFSFQNYGFVGVNNGFHNFTHHGAGDTALIEQHRKVNGHYAAQFTKLVQKVSSLVDANGVSVLNDVIITMSSGMGDSNLHDRSKGIPMVMAGGANLGVPQGKIYQTAASMSEIGRTVLALAGVPEATLTGFGAGTGHLVDALKKL